METLPPELHMYIGEFLPIYSLKQLRRTCRYFSGIFRSTLFRDGFLKKSLTCGELELLPLETMSSRNLQRGEDIRKLPTTLKRMIINLSNVMSPKIMRECENITFYISTYQLKHSDYNVQFFEKIPNLRLYSDGGWLCFHNLQLYKKIRFHRLVFSHIETCYHEGQTPESAVEGLLLLISEMTIDNLVLNYPVGGYLEESMVRLIEKSQKITFLSTNVFRRDTVFPLKIFSEMTNLEDLRFEVGSLVNLDELVKLKYRYILIGGEKCYGGVKCLSLLMYRRRFVLKLDGGNIYRTNVAFILKRRGRTQELWEKHIFLYDQLMKYNC